MYNEDNDWIMYVFKNHSNQFMAMACSQAAGLEEGNHLTAIAVDAKLEAPGGAFAVFCSGGDRIVTWGDPDAGGDSSGVQDQIKGVQQVQRTILAFAAILTDGSVVTWGDKGRGGDSSKVHDQLQGLQQVQATSSAFAAILADGSVVTWGNADAGGDSSEVQEQLKGVQHVQEFNVLCICCCSGRWMCGDLGRSRCWRWQLWGPRSAQRCPAGPSNNAGICGYPGRWISGDLGLCRVWWWQLWSPRSAERCPATSRNFRRVCCHPCIQKLVVTALR